MPVQQVVATAFTDALKARGLISSTGSGRVDIVINIRDFDANQIVRREANVDLLVRVLEPGSDKTVFQDEVKKTIVRGNIITLDAGVLASPDDLRDVAQVALRQAIDEAVDKPAFRAALRM